MASSTGPPVLWRQLEGKKVVSKDGKEIGEIKEVSQNYVRVEKGKVNKDKFWIPKYIVDVFDGKNVWLVTNAQETLDTYLTGHEPSAEEYTRNFETFKSSPYGQNVELLDWQSVRVTNQRPMPSSAEETTGKDYKNIRELD